MADGWSHTFKTTLSLDHLNVLLTKACRHPFRTEVEAHDFNVIPAYRVIEARFATVEDRDRTIVVLRQIEKEQIAASKANPRRTPEHQGAAAARPAAPAPARAQTPPGARPVPPSRG